MNAREYNEHLLRIPNSFIIYNFLISALNLNVIYNNYKNAMATSGAK